MIFVPKIHAKTVALLCICNPGLTPRVTKVSPLWGSFRKGFVIGASFVRFVKNELPTYVGRQAQDDTLSSIRFVKDESLRMTPLVNQLSYSIRQVTPVLSLMKKQKASNADFFSDSDVTDNTDFFLIFSYGNY
jgi:hypothetical protein